MAGVKAVLLIGLRVCLFILLLRTLIGNSMNLHTLTGLQTGLKAVLLVGLRVQFLNESLEHL
jgi:hypothetical protein